MDSQGEFAEADEDLAETKQHSSVSDSSVSNIFDCFMLLGLDD